MNEKKRLNKELKQVNQKLIRYKNLNELEKFAREEKYFKKANEDIFVITED